MDFRRTAKTAAVLGAGLALGWAAARLAAGAPLFPYGPRRSPEHALEAPFPPPAPSDPSAFTLLAVGDIQLGRKVGPVIAEKGWAYPFRAVAPLVSGADLAFANLECPASYLGAPYPGKPPVVTFRARPGDLFGLKAAGFDVVSLANNHAGDYGPQALTETMKALRLLDIAVCGAGEDETAARKPAILDAGGMKVAFLAYAEPIWSVAEAKDGPGTAIIDEAEIRADIAAAQAASDVVVLSLHWGEEHQASPREEDRALARRLVDAGADAVIGHHPHVLQGAEFYRGAPIIYSLGNFVFDMVSPATYDGAAVLLDFKEGRVEGIRFVPIAVDRETFAPEPAAGDRRGRILSLMAERSALVGSAGTITEDGLFSLKKPELSPPKGDD